MFTKDEIILFEQFICFYSNNFYNYIPNIPLYCVHCKIKNDNIDFISDIGLIYTNCDNTLYYLDINYGKYLNKSEYNQKFETFGFFIGVYKNYIIED